MWRRASDRLRRLLLLYGIAWLRLQGVHGEMGNPVEAKGTQGDSITLPGAVSMDQVVALTWSKVEGSGQIRIAVYMYKPKGTGEQSNSLGPLKGRAELMDRGSLRIKDLKLRDEGMYVLTALLEEVGPKERHVSLEVIVPPKLELNPRQDVYERRGKAVKLTCTVSHARPMVKYIRWEKDGGPVDQHHEATTYPGKDSYESVLSLRNLTKSDSGNYTCVTGHLERIVAASRHVEVHYPATIVNASDLVVAPVLTKVTLWCVADGNPPPNITWFKLGWQNEPTATLEPSDSTRNNIIFNEIHRNDSGKYACSAANGIGKQDWRTISLVVRDSTLNSGIKTPLIKSRWETALLGTLAGAAVVFLCILIALACRGNGRGMRDNPKLVAISPPIYSYHPSYKQSMELRSLRHTDSTSSTVVTRSGKVFARALCDYSPQDDNELPLQTNDVIEVLSDQNGGWWFGSVQGKVGLFPAKCVEILVCKDRQDGKKCYARALYDYDPCEEGELQLQVGDVMEIVSREDPGWWYGYLRGKVGLFPSNYVEVVPESSVGDLSELSPIRSREPDVTLGASSASTLPAADVQLLSSKVNGQHRASCAMHSSTKRCNSGYGGDQDSSGYHDSSGYGMEEDSNTSHEQYEFRNYQKPSRRKSGSSNKGRKLSRRSSEPVSNSSNPEADNCQPEVCHCNECTEANQGQYTSTQPAAQNPRSASQNNCDQNTTDNRDSRTRHSSRRSSSVRCHSSRSDSLRCHSDNSGSFRCFDGYPESVYGGSETNVERYYLRPEGERQEPDSFLGSSVSGSFPPSDQIDSSLDGSDNEVRRYDSDGLHSIEA
ncbi:uncharacterized protein [Branchiostoma lanceolatum]|uniref:uncharacterized protein n=1 Tax=Branchiostoma lanceolatum TaxID=7740 RepID=UPI00345275A0